jgi:hypothetical protein|tara:strand:- start:2459 stop:3139 length:681 start_codon:yes stop_codon:yes gene_type:complete
MSSFLKYRYIGLLLFFQGLIASPLDENDLKDFIEGRYSGDTSLVFSMISNDFMYIHKSYSGIGIEAHYVDGSLIVTNIVNDSLLILISTGDKIHEQNGVPVNKEGLQTSRKLGEINKFIITKAGDTTFTEISIPSNRFKYRQNSQSFLESIVKYSGSWYDFDVDFHDIIIKKNKAIVHYSWEGSKEEGGTVYFFTSIEICEIEKKTKLIKSIEGQWSEKQFREQFK